MPIIDLFAAEFNSEMANTRKILERVPNDKLTWKPHDKNFTVQDLASHVANLPFWTVPTLQQDHLDFAPAGQPAFQTPKAESQEQLLQFFDDNVSKAKAAMKGVTDEQMMTPWSLMAGGRILFTMPRWVVQRTFMMNHLIHHRAQLGLYLRLLGVAIPGMYGPSADDPRPPM